MSRSQLAHLVLGVLVLVCLTGLVLRIGRVPAGRGPVVAVVRAAVQLSVVGLLLRGAITQPAAVGFVLLVMLTVATRTAARRMPDTDGAWPAVAAACVAGVGTSLLVVFGLGVLPLDSRYVVAAGGIVVGASMTGTTLAGRRLHDGLIARREEVEAWLALGATMRYAVADIAREAAAEALVPALDQTRTTGLVTLPGAFIGALLGGASPIQAARFQLVVLTAVLTTQAIAAVVLVRLLGAPAVLPERASTSAR